MAAVDSGATSLARSICEGLGTASPDSQFAVGYYHLLGVIGEERLRIIVLLGTDELTTSEREHFNKGTSLLRLAAEAGIVDAQYVFGLVSNVSQNANVHVENRAQHDESEKWLIRAADADHPQANLLLGRRALPFAPRFGPFIEKPAYERFLIRAAELGVLDAIDLLKRIEETAAAANDPSTLTPVEKRNLAFDLALRRDPTPPKAVALMKAAADEHNIEAMLTMARWNWPEAPSVAQEYLLKAAEAGNVNATHGLGELHACTGNVKEARKYFVLAKKLGHAVAALSIEELDEWGIDDWSCQSVL
ncbi:MAG: hypothetical protein AAGH76_16825 [Pseudomonadota bacterium]